MSKAIFVFSIISVLFIIESSCQVRIIRPTYRPPPSRGPIIRTAREAKDDEPGWLFKGDDIPRAPATGDHPFLPSIIDDIKLDPNRRYARSLSTPSATRGSQRTSRGSSRDTGPTHPGYNRRNARSVDSPSARRSGGSHSTSSGSRDTGATHPGYNRRNARDVVIPNWNPNARSQPWQRIKLPHRNIRSVEMLDSQESLYRGTRSVEQLDSQEMDIEVVDG